MRRRPATGRGAAPHAPAAERPRRRGAGRRASTLLPALLVAALGADACASGGGYDMSTTPPTPDPRVGLAAGWENPGVASWNLRLVSNSPPPEAFRGVSNSDLAFVGQYAIQGNYNGFQVWDLTNPRDPELAREFLCPASQSDVSVYRNLLFVSGEGLGGRLDCGPEGVPEPVSHHRLRGIRIFDIADIRNPRYIGNVQTCRGSHTHTVLKSPADDRNVYVYVSGSAQVRPEEELAGCSAAPPAEDPNTALFRIEVIRVPLANPAQAAIVSSPRIFEGLRPAPRHAADTTNRPPPQTGPTQCHDITVYPAIGRAGGACGGYGLLLDITDPANPRRIHEVADPNFAFWHSATFSNDGSKILFTDEWGGGSQPRCRASDRYEWGANAIFTIVNDRMQFQSYYKMPAAQTEVENCVAHNGSLVPIPGRDVMVQGWYQGGISVFDWTDPANPVEIAYYDRGPVNAEKLQSGGSWSVYWYNGLIVNSEIARGLDVYELVPSGFLSRNEIEAAKTVRWDYLNAQEQPEIVWPPSFALARAYLDQLERHNGLAAERIAAARSTLERAEDQSGQARRETLTQLASSLQGDVGAAFDPDRVRALAAAVRDLATAGVAQD